MVPTSSKALRCVLRAKEGKNANTYIKLEDVLVISKSEMGY